MVHRISNQRQRVRAVLCYARKRDSASKHFVFAFGLLLFALHFSGVLEQGRSIDNRFFVLFYSPSYPRSQTPNAPTAFAFFCSISPSFELFPPQPPPLPCSYSSCSCPSPPPPLQPSDFTASSKYLFLTVEVLALHSMCVALCHDLQSISLTSIHFNFFTSASCQFSLCCSCAVCTPVCAAAASTVRIPNTSAVRHHSVLLARVIVTACAATGTSDDGGCWAVHVYPSAPSLVGLLLYASAAAYCLFVFVGWAWLADPQVDVSGFLTSADCRHTQMFSIRRYLNTQATASTNYSLSHLKHLQLLLCVVHRRTRPCVSWPWLVELGYSISPAFRL